MAQIYVSPSAASALPDDGTRPAMLPPGLLVPFFLVTALFFLWAIPNNMNDVLIPQFMKSFELSRFQAVLVQSAFYMGYFLLAMPAALLMKRIGYKAGIIIGLLLFSVGTLLFWPAAVVQSYNFFLLALFVIASGLAFLETAANPFIAQLGDPRSSERRLNFSQAFNPLGAITAAFIGTKFIFSGIKLSPAQVTAMQAANTYKSYLQQETLRVKGPYIVLSIITLVWAGLILRTKFPDIQSEHEHAGEDASFRHLISQRHFVLGVLAQFLYVGAQVGTWSYFITYVEDYTLQPERVAGYFLTGTLAAFGIGRFASAGLMKYVKPNMLMGIFSVINVGLLMIAVFHPGWAGLWAVFFTSLFMSLMFPTIFALGIKNLGPSTKIGGSVIIMSIVGGAVLPLIMGLISVHFHNLALAYLVPMAAFAAIGYYSFYGSEVRDPVPGDR
ncbi:Fucose permease [Acidisarcina polymorpha]|uniref:Fucose permease n=1 Tax=Acidisarcina polymorpha TaxID=2211140 RepID=A0A2Z5G3Q2_9BACT|nr:L-fucose:H+ symporter permease [Acidisarcina polymorpha]AXC13255.1 Fucose permease [Acidisarcina polymorpha]